jgi:hypothetical protein
MPKGQPPTRPLTPLDRLKDLTRRLVAVPKAEIDARAKLYRRSRQKRKRAVE